VSRVKTDSEDGLRAPASEAAQGGWPCLMGE
jgi:hypothetical protein